MALPLLVVVSGPPGSGKPAVAWERINRRADEQPARHLVHGDRSLHEPFESFERMLARFDSVALPVPSIAVDTTAGPNPDLEAMVAFVNQLSETPSDRG